MELEASWKLGFTLHSAARGRGGCCIFLKIRFPHPHFWLLCFLPRFQNAVPFFVNATCGTTVLGAFDPVAEIAEVCSRHKVWLHVDVSIPYIPWERVGEALMLPGDEAGTTSNVLARVQGVVSSRQQDFASPLFFFLHMHPNSS